MRAGVFSILRFLISKLRKTIVFAMNERMARQQTIGVLMDYHIPGVINGAGAYVAEHGLRIDSRWSVRADWMPDQPGWDAVITHVIDMEKALVRVEEFGIPMVHLKPAIGRAAGPCLEVSFEACARIAVEEFQRMGLGRVAVPLLESHPVGRDSCQGVVDAARELGLECVRLNAWRAGMTWLEGVAAMVGELAALAHPCGLFHPHAGVVFSLLEGLAKRGVRVPEDLAIIVIDKDVQRTAELAPVSLSAVMLDEWQRGYEAAALAHRMILGEPVGNEVRKIAPIGLVRRQSTGTEATKDPVVAKALYLMREHLRRIDGVGALATEIGVSRRTLETRFRRATRSTLHATLTARRMEEAKRLLRSGRLPVAEVAEILGFSSVHYFTTAFKREVGSTPGVYRAGQS